MIILASASPRRSELLRNAGIPFRVKPAHVPEFPENGEKPLDYCRRLARDKARKIHAEVPDCFVLGADTIVIADEHILEKPKDADDAVRMLRMLSGRTHEVSTGVCLIGPDGNGGTFEDIDSETTRVTFSEMTEAEIRAYVASGEPTDRAGSYAIQEQASRWAKSIAGCYFNVVGLPVPLVYRMLKKRGAIG
jgi:septum formation protein